MQQYILRVSVSGVETLPYQYQNLAAMQDMVEGYIEVVYKRFPDESIVLVVNEEGMALNLPPTCKTKHEILCGTVLIVSEYQADEGIEFGGLTKDQCAIAKEHIDLLRGMVK